MTGAVPAWSKTEKKTGRDSTGAPNVLARWRARGPAGTGSVGDSVGEGPASTYLLGTWTGDRHEGIGMRGCGGATSRSHYPGRQAQTVWRYSAPARAPSALSTTCNGVTCVIIHTLCRGGSAHPDSMQGEGIRCNLSARGSHRHTGLRDSGRSWRRGPENHPACPSCPVTRRHIAWRVVTGAKSRAVQALYRR